jgi:hypothetical protein
MPGLYAMPASNASAEPMWLGGHGVAQLFLEAFQWHRVKRGDAFGFYAGNFRVEGPHPSCSNGGNLGNGSTRTAMYTERIEQLRGTAGARQVRVRAETPLAAFTTPRNDGWIMFGKSPNWPPVPLKVMWLAAITLSP